MLELQKKKLNVLLRKINQNVQLKEQYDSKWHRIIHFLHKNTRCKIAKVAVAGSKAKQTDYHKSDLDIIFCTSPEIAIIKVLNHIKEKANENFKDVAYVSKSKRAVHVDFKHPKLEIEIVYLALQEFNKEHNEIKDFGKLPEFKKNAIKLAKYAIDKTIGEAIKGRQIEIKCINSNCKSLIACINECIHSFSGILKKKGYKIKDVLKYLT